MNSALWCILGRRLQLPCRCAAWLTQRLAGSQSQRRGSSATSVQCVRMNGGGREREKGGREEIGRCKDTERKEPG